jgi:hypothetical protein
MIEIRCNKCGTVNDNPYAFGNCRFTFTEKEEIGNGNHGHQCRTIHLCNGCQTSLKEAIWETESKFIGVGSLGLNAIKGIL